MSASHLRYSAIEGLESRMLLADTAHFVADITQGPGSGASYFSGQSAALGSYLYFAGPGGLWKSDGTAANTALVKALVQTPGGVIGNMVAGNGVVYFTDNDGGGTQIWQSDGNDATKVSSFTNGEVPSHLTFVDNKLYFVTLFTNPGVWRLAAGQPNGAVQIKQVDDPFLMGSLNGSQFFASASTTPSLFSLWKTDGTSATFVKDFSLVGKFSPSWATYKNRFYFGASPLLNDVELWSSDGTGAGTQRVADIRPGDEASIPNHFVLSGGTLYFAANDPTNSGQQIYSTSGAGVTKVTSLSPGALLNLVDVAGTLYSVFSTSTAVQLYKLSGSTLTPITAGNSGNPASDSLTAVGSTLFFAATGTDAIRRLFETDGTTITPVGGEAGTGAANLLAVKNRLLYTAADTAHGTELHEVTPATAEFSVALRANGRSSATVNEGDTVNFATVLQGITRDKVAKYYFLFEGVGKLVVQGPKPSHQYLDNLPILSDFYDVRCKVVFKDGQARNAYVKVKVLNKKPEVDILFKGDDVNPTIDGDWATWNPMSVEVKVKDATKEDLTVVGINWGDGSPIEVHPVGDGTVISGHTFRSASPPSGFVIRIFARDKDGAETVRKPVLVIDPFVKLQDVKGRPVYRMGGTSGNDHLQIRRIRQTVSGIYEFRVTLNETVLANLILRDELEFSDLNVIVAHMGPGNDAIDFDPGPFIRLLSGDSGSDTFNTKPIK